MSAVAKEASQKISREDAEEFTQSLGQIMGGGWRQIALAKRMGIPQALGLSIEDWVEKRLGGYIRLSVTDRRDAVKELTDQGMSHEGIGEILGIAKASVARDLAPMSAVLTAIVQVQCVDRPSKEIVKLPREREPAVPAERIYFLKAGPFIKIGFTSLPIHLRIAQLQTGCPYQISVIGQINGTIEHERELHQRFIALNSFGEWFRDCEKIQSFIRDAIGGQR